MGIYIGNNAISKIAAGSNNIQKVYNGSQLVVDFTSPSTPPPTVPDAPTGLSSIAGDGELSLSWSAPASDGGSSITNYSVRYIPFGGSTSTETTLDASTSYTLTSLSNGTEYTVDVAAINIAGTGTYSSSITDTPGIPPSSPPPSSPPPSSPPPSSPPPTSSPPPPTSSPPPPP